MKPKRAKMVQLNKRPEFTAKSLFPMERKALTVSGINIDRELESGRRPKLEDFKNYRKTKLSFAILREFLKKSFPDICITPSLYSVLGNSMRERKVYRFMDFLVQYEYPNKEKVKVYIDEKTKTVMDQCLKRGYRYGYFDLSMVNFKTDSGHKNALLFDLKNKKVYRYEPHGHYSEQTRSRKGINDALNKFFKRMGYTYISPINFCPKYGPQYKENFQTRFYKENRSIGHCEVFSMLFLVDLIRNPTKSPEELMRDYEDMDPNESALRVRRFMVFITKLAKRWEKEYVPKNFDRRKRREHKTSYLNKL